MIETESELREKVDDGYSIVNRGVGWYASKNVAYKQIPSIKIKEELIDNLEKTGIIKITIPYTSARAEFVK